MKMEQGYLTKLAFRAVVLLLIIGILALDVWVPAGVAVGVLYVLPLFLTQYLKSIRFLISATLLSSLCIFMGWYLSHEAGMFYQVILNRSLSLFAIWIVCSGLVRFKILAEKNEKVHIQLSSGMEEFKKQRRIFTSLLQDIKEAKAESEKAEERFRLVVEESPHAMIMVNKKGVIGLVNNQTEALFRYTRAELMGQKIEMLVPERYRSTHPSHRDGFFSDPKPRSMGGGRDLFGLRKDKFEVPIEIGLNPIETPYGFFTLASIIDITERKKAEESEKIKSKQLKEAYEELKSIQTQLIQIEKVSLLGQLSAGVAHELNSPLTGLMGLLKSYKKNMKEGTIEHREQSKMIEATERMARIVDGLNTYARQSRGEFMELSMEDVVESTLSFSAKELTDNGIKINKKFMAKGLKILGDRSQLQQVIVNVITNARDAMLGGGEFSIQTSSDEKHVFLDLTDTGRGINEENLNKIFDPFFTTKPPGKGTGLGLSIAHGILEAHHGKLTVEHILGKGACFRCALPIAKERSNQ